MKHKDIYYEIGTKKISCNNYNPEQDIIISPATYQMLSMLYLEFTGDIEPTFAIDDSGRIYASPADNVVLTTYAEDKSPIKDVVRLCALNKYNPIKTDYLVINTKKSDQGKLTGKFIKDDMIVSTITFNLWNGELLRNKVLRMIHWHNQCARNEQDGNTEYPIHNTEDVAKVISAMTFLQERKKMSMISCYEGTEFNDGVNRIILLSPHSGYKAMKIYP